jgi:alkanesulfonate monooxygenase SsuD/methylene tetrahydromethanopterin reductase-like flavin-dependent oxidoreductase (luciferase family)
VIHLAVALDGAGWHPAAWRERSARPSELLSAAYWVDVVLEAERGLIDFVTIEDSLGLPSRRTDQVTGRPDAVLVAARVAPLTSRIGLMPTVVATHTEPFHISKAIATLDFVSEGRAGVRVKVSASADDARHFGRRSMPLLDPPRGELMLEAADYIEVVRRLWDSWEDDAEIRDVATGRFVDREKLHYIDFTGPRFSVKGPSITPRPPQGQPVVGVLGHRAEPFALIASSADVGFVTPSSAAHAASLVSSIGAPSVRVFADLVVFLGSSVDEAAERKARMDERAGYVYTSDATVFTGTPSQLAALLLDWASAGLEGFRLRPGAIPDDLTYITRSLVPELQRQGVFRTSYEASTFRGLLGLPRPLSRYATN